MFPIPCGNSESLIKNEAPWTVAKCTSSQII